MKIKKFLLIFLILLLPSMTQTGYSSIDTPQLDDRTDSKQQNSLKTDKSKLATIILPFIENVGQADSKVRFYANTFAGTMFVTNEDLVYSIPNPSHGDTMKHAYSVIRENLGHLNISGIQKSTAGVSYFVGNDKDNWHVDVPTYDLISLDTVWPGVHLDLKAHGSNVEKIFTIFPSGNVHDIRIQVSGIQKLGIDDGKLVLYTDRGYVSMTKPVAYQYVNNDMKLVDVSYVVSDTSYGFEIGHYDHSYPVIIDPILQSTYLGGSDREYETAIALDSSNNVYVTGYTYSADFPGTSGGAQSIFGVSTLEAVFVSKLNPSLTSLVQSTYLLGTVGGQIANAIALDSSNNVYVVGSTSSNDFPGTSGGVQPTLGGNVDVFISKLNSGLTSIIQSTYLGGISEERPSSIVLDSSNNVYVTGYTLSPDFLGTSGGAQSTIAGSPDAFISKLNSGLTSIQSTYLGGSGYDIANSIAFDSSNNVYVAGYTTSSDFPGTSGGVQPTRGGLQDAFISKLNSALTSISQSTYLGGVDNDVANSIALDSSNNVYVAGYTTSSDFPGTSGGIQSTYGGGGLQDAFISKLNSALTSISQSTYLGGGYNDAANSIALNSNNVYVAGYTYSPDFPGTSGGVQPIRGGTNDAFISKLNSALTSISQSTYLGGSGYDAANSIAFDSSNNVYVAGGTDSFDFPGTSGGAQSTYDGGISIFISKLVSSLRPPTPCSVPGSGNWVVTSSCTLQSSALAHANIVVNSGVILTVPNGVSLNIDFKHFHLLVKPGGEVLIQSGGKIN